MALDAFTTYSFFRLGDFFDARVKISYNRFAANDDFPVEFQLKAKDSVGRGMLRTHVECLSELFSGRCNHLFSVRSESGFSGL